MKKISLAFLLFVSVLSCAAQTNAMTAVRWRTTVKMVSPTEGIVTIKALVGDGWHLYSTKLPENGPKPTSFNFSTSAGVKFMGDFIPSQKPVTKFDKAFNANLSWWESNVTFTCKFKLTGKGSAVIQGTITYMACNGLSCLPPKTESVKVNVPAFK